jgi:hypothetical protein
MGVLVGLALSGACTRVNPAFRSGPPDTHPGDDGPRASDSPGDLGPQPPPPELSPDANTDLAADAADTDAAPDSLPPPPPVLIVGSARPLSWHGGGGGVLHPDDRCPPGQVVIGHQGAVSDEKPYVGRVQMLCGGLRVTRTEPPFTVEVTPGTMLAARGHSAGVPWTAICPSNEVVVGYSGQADTFVESLRTHCAPLEVLADRSGIRIGVVRDLPAYGTGTAPAFQAHCHLQGQVVVGADTRTGGWLDAIRPQCAPITVGL